MIAFRFSYKTRSVVAALLAFYSVTEHYNQLSTQTMEWGKICFVLSMCKQYKDHYVIAMGWRNHFKAHMEYNVYHRIGPP